MSTLFRSVCTLIVLVTFFLFAPATVFSQGECSPFVSPDPTSGSAGTRFNFYLECFNPNSSIMFHVAGPNNYPTWDGPMPIDADGRLWTYIDVLPEDPGGTYTVWTEVEGITVASATFQVIGNQPPPEPPSIDPPPVEPPSSDPPPAEPPSSNPPPVDPSVPVAPVEPVVPAEPVAPAQPEVSTFSLPTTGPCQVAAQGNTGVNVRSIPTTVGDIVGKLEPNTAYDAVGQASMADGLWYELGSGGWVASFVTRQGGECNSLPFTYDTTSQPEPPAPDSEGVPESALTNAPRLLKYSVSLDGALNGCPNILAEAQELPIFMQLDIYSMPDGCGYTQGVLSEVVFELVPQVVPVEIEQAMMAACPAEMPNLQDFMLKIWGADRALWQRIYSRLTPQDACEVASQISRGTLAPSLWDGDLDSVVALSASACLTTDQARIETLMQKARDLQLDPAGLAVDCFQIDLLNSFGNHLPVTSGFLADAMRQCGYTNPLSIMQVQHIALGNNVNILQMLREADFADFCTDPFGVMADYAADHSDPTQQVLGDLAPQFNDCPWISNILSSFGPEISELEMFSILHSADSCEMAALYIKQGRVPVMDDPPACFDPVSQRFMTGDEPLLGDLDWNKYSAWGNYVSILKDLDLCEWTVVIEDAGGDTDQDTIVNDLDACPNKPGAGLDGCPIIFGGIEAPADTADNAVLVAQADVRIAPGEVRWLPYASPDEIADITNLFAANTLDHAVALASLENGQLKLEGIAPGITQVTLFFADGFTTENVVFTVEVGEAVPAAIVPIADQTMVVGSTLSVPIHFDNPDGRLLVMTAQSGAPDVALAFVAVAPQIVHDGVVNLAAMAVGTTPVTVTIIEMGQNPNPAQFTFTLNVIPAPAAPLPAPPVVAPIPEQNLPAQGEIRLPIEEAAAPGVDAAAASANPQVATAQVIGGEIVITGHQPGVAAVTVVIQQGTGASSATFTVTVTAVEEAAPAQPAEPQPEVTLNPLLVEGHPDLLVTALPLPAYVLDYGLTGRDTGAAAVFQGQPNSIYHLHNGEPILLRVTGHYPALSPNRHVVAYLTDQLDLRIFNLAQGMAAPVDDSLPFADYPPAWSSDGAVLYFTLDDGIYSYDINAPATPPQLLIQGGRAPAVSPDGRYIAFEMEQTGQSAIYVAALANPTETRPMFEDGIACTMPLFSSDSLSLFFTCQVDEQPAMFRVGIGGVEPLDVGIANAQRPAPGPVEGFFAFDDGNTIYFANEDLSQVAPLVRLPNVQLSLMRWLTRSSKN